MLNIKNPEAHRLAHELAAREGTTLTQAVTEALRDALTAHTTRVEQRRQVLRGLMSAARESEDPTTKEAFAELYDDHTGLPR